MPRNPLIDDFEAHLRATGKSARTITIYLGALDQLTEFMPDTPPEDMKRRHLERYFAWMLTRPNRVHPGKTVAASYVAQQYRSIRCFFRWLVDEDEITVSPFAKMKPPAVPEKPVPILNDDEIKAMLRSAAGNSFEARRDTALIRLFLDTGCRRAEILGLRMADVDLQYQTITVVGKGNRTRIVPFGAKTSDALRRYLRARAKHKAAGTDSFWLGRRGPLADVRRILQRHAGKDVHPHQLRHSAAHLWLLNGGNETDLRRLMGWKSPEMVYRYAASAGTERAILAHRKLSIADQF